MKIILDKNRKVIATHDESQVITKETYPQSEYIINAESSIISYDEESVVEIDIDGYESKVSRKVNPHVSEDVDLGQYLEPSTSTYVFPLPVVESLIPSEEFSFNKDLSDLLDRLSLRGGKVVTDPKDGTVTAIVFDSVVSLLSDEVQKAISQFKA